MKQESGSKRLNKYAFNKPVSLMKIQRILEEIQKSPKNTNQIGDVVGFSPKTASTYLCFLRSKNQAYIKHWIYEKRGLKDVHVAYWSKGSKPDAIKPLAMTQREIQRRRRAKLKSEGKMDAINAKRRLNRSGIKIQPELQIWMRKPESSSSGQTEQE